MSKFPSDKKVQKNPHLEQELNYPDEDHAIAHGYNTDMKLRNLSSVIYDFTDSSHSTIELYPTAKLQILFEREEHRRMKYKQSRDRFS
jgi:hypothetical protein